MQLRGTALGGRITAHLRPCQRMRIDAMIALMRFRSKHLFAAHFVVMASLAIPLLRPASTLAQANDKTAKSKLSESFVLEPVRVFYATDGESAIDPTDADHSGVPDRVEDVARQIWATRELLCGVLGFPDPFDSERFAGVNCIQVSLLDRSRINNLNGVAYRIPQKAKPVPGGNPDDRALIIALSSTIDARLNASPSHEFFHLLQYGCTYLSNRWFLEGMARWSERSLGEGGIGKILLSSEKSWPQSLASRELLYESSYDAAMRLWNPLAKLVDPQGELPAQNLPAHLTALKYSDGSKVLRDDLFNGATLMRDVLIELGTIDDRVMAELGYDSWTLANQGGAGNNDYIYEAMIGVLRRAPGIAAGEFRAKPE